MKQALIDEFSYASEAHSLGRILAIRAVETMSGQPFLKKTLSRLSAGKPAARKFLGRGH
ncbi:hypothetical protein N9L93_05145 [Alphaproteobacteria bacterium]|nr:hypothetical protein [Alphaproteobacteria bacterium]